MFCFGKIFVFFFCLVNFISIFVYKNVVVYYDVEIVEGIMYFWSLEILIMKYFYSFGGLRFYYIGC